MVSTNNKGHPNLTPQRSLEYPLVLDTANIANFRQLANSKVGADARTLKEMCPFCLLLNYIVICKNRPTPKMIAVSMRSTNLILTKLTLLLLIFFIASLVLFSTSSAVL